jgi:two-component system, response regulator
MYNTQFHVVYAEDDPVDAMAIKRTWRKQNIDNPLHIVRDGEECLDFLFNPAHTNHTTRVTIPGVIILDINMPKLDGFSVLQRIRDAEDERFRHIPVVMFTSSELEADRLKCYRLGANAFIVKPSNFQQFSEAIKLIMLFWGLVHHTQL